MNANEILAALIFGGKSGGGGSSLPDPVTISHGGTGVSTLNGAKHVFGIDTLEEDILLKVQASNIAENFDIEADYEAGNMVFVNGDLVRFKVDHEAGEIEADEIESVMIAKDIEILQTYLEQVYTCETMTMTQYEALTPAQKMDGTVRFINDIDTLPDAGGVGF